MHRMLFVLAATASMLSPSVAGAAGEIVITQEEVLEGDITPGDRPGFPVTITRPGVYVLGGLLIVPRTSSSAVVIATRFVTFDLGGFSISAGISPRSGRGIVTGAGGFPPSNVTIRNGGIAGFLGGAIDADRNVGWSVENVDITGFNNADAIRLGDFGRVEQSRIVAIDQTPGYPSAWGVTCRSHCLVIGNIISAQDGVAMISGTILNNHIQAGVLDSTVDHYAIRGGSPGPVGYGNNTIIGEVFRATQLQANVCNTPCDPP